MVANLSWETTLKHDRCILGGMLGLIAFLAWIYMAHEARGMNATGVCRCLGMKMSGPDTQAWSPNELLPLSIMWSEMMIAMMLPSAAPMILMFAAVNRKRRLDQRPFVPTGIFAGGYFISWTLFSIALAVVQWALHSAAILSPRMASQSDWFAGSILIVTGIFQWTPMKQSCLAKCRTPLDFLLTEWREGPAGALKMGLKQGAFCIGCCWLLMVLLFVAGVMNLWWIALITIFVLIEKLIPRGLWFARGTGLLLAGWGICLIGARLL